MPVSDAGWEGFGQFVMAVGAIAMIAYLLPMAVALPPPWARRLEVATFALIGLALVLALAATVAWFAGR